MEETKHKDVFNVTRQIQFPMKLFGDKGGAATSPFTPIRAAALGAAF